MTRVCLENLMRTDRPLMWLPEPTCDLCSLPFASYSDGREDRLPLLLSCGHLLCGPCVLKHAQGESIQCDRCNKEVSVPNNYGNVLMALHPSLYMLGRMSRMQQELEVIELYCLNEDPKAQEAKDAVHANEMPESYYIESLSANDLKAPKQLINLLECAFDAHERSTFAYQKRAQSYPNNVDHVIKKVTAHFLNLHNALQIEEERVLKQVRKAYLEQRQHTEHQQQHLIAVKERLKKLHTRVKHLKRDSPVSDEKSWLKLSEEVKRYLETEPLKLLKNNSPIPFTSFYPEGDKVLKNIRKSYRLTVPDYRTPLLPFAATRKKQKNDSDLLTSVNEEENRSAAATPTTSRESAPSERRNHRDGRKASKLSDKSMYSSVSRRDKKSSKSGFKYAQRVSLNAARKEELARCFSTVTITCIVNPHEIYVQDDLHNVATKALIELCQTEAEEYEAILLTAKYHLHVEAGKLYLVQPTSSDSWYRARVLEVLNGTETTTEHSLVTYKVQYIDFGGKDTVLHEQIRPITDDLAQIDSKAMKCSLYGIASPEYDSDEGETRWPEECHQLMTDFVGNRKMLMYELDSSATDCFIVDFFHLPLTSSSTSAIAAAVNDTINVTCWEGCYAPMSLRKTLINLQQCLEELQEDLNPEAFNRLQLLDAWLMNAAEEAKRRCTIPPALELKEYDLFDVHITHSKSPDCLYIMPMEWKKDRFDKLQEELDALCQQPSVYKVFPPYVGLVCGFSLAAQDQSRVWLRGRVTKLVPGICEMFALDTGETMIVRCEDLHLFPPASGPMCEYPLAVCCRLEHIHPKPVDGGGAGCFSSWSAEAVDEFNMLMKSKTLPFAAKVGSLWKESGVYSVLLYLRNKSDVDTCINKMLVKQGHAECNLGKEAEIADLAHKMELDDTATVGGNVSVLSRKVIDPRVPIDVLRVVTPDEIYVRLSSRKADLDGLHQTIQQHMDEVFDGEAGETEDSSTGWQVGDICLVFASPPDGSSIEWYRARIIDVPEEGELYEAFLIDSALKVQVHRTNVARMVPRIAQLQPGAVRCQLACIEPVKSSKHWSKVAVDALIGIIHSYESHAISLDVKRPQKAAEDNLPDATRSLSVVLWGVRVSVRQALAPQKTEYRNINQLLAVRGMAHLSGTFRIFATKGDGAREELQSIEEAVEKMTLCEYEKLQQFFRTVAADSTEAERFGARENGNETAEVVLTTKSVDTEAVRVEIDGACASVLSLAKHKVESITEWPAGDPINKTVFVGMPTHIGNDGTVFLYDMSREPVLHHIRDMINEHMQNSAGDSRKTDVFKPGEPCLAKYHLDGLFYRATIVSVHKGNKYRVLFVDYGNEEACRGQNLRKDIICGRVPVQTNRFRLTGIAPTQASAKGKSSWPEDAIMACHGLCVQQPCTVRVDTSIWSADLQQDSAIRLPIPCKLVRLKDSVDVISTLLDLGVFQYCREKTVEYDKCNVVRPSSRRYDPIAYPMTSVDQGPSRLLPLCTPEERDLMQFMQDIETSIQIDRISKDFEDPNEIPDDTGVDSGCLNRAQLINLPDDDEYQQQQIEQHYCTLPSPASFISSELETSTRLGSEERDYERNSVSIRPAGALMHGGLFASPVDWNQTRGFFAEFTNLSDGLTVHVFPHLEGHTHRIARMSESVQSTANQQEELVRWQASLVEIGSACLAPYRADGLYYRAIIVAIYDDTKEVGVLYVDYLNRDNVPISELRKCPLSVRAVPLRNAEVQLCGVRPNPRLRQDDIGRRMMEVLVRPFYVRIVSTNRAEPDGTVRPEVQFYTDYDCNTLAYQKMIEEKYFYSTKS